MSFSWDSDLDPDSDIDSGELEDEGPTSRRVYHASGTQSSVYRQLEHSEKTPTRWVAVKIVSFIANTTKKPHDVTKEAKLLIEQIRHPNVVSVYKYDVDNRRQQYELRLPLLPLSVTDLLESPYFVPRPPGTTIGSLPPSIFLSFPGEEAKLFAILAKSISFQVLLALSYLHTLPVPIAHRDIKPSNVLIDASGCVQLIDFGIAWQDPGPTAQSQNLEQRSPYDTPEESSTEMSTQVGSGSYRAIELLFSPTVYDACATDLWSFAVTLSSFFTNLRWVRASMYDDESEQGDNDSDRDEDDEFGTSSMRWSRRTLFKASRGEIAQIWSIFRLLGTPTETKWPEFRALPGAQMMSFTPTEPSHLESRLVNLPPSSTSENASPVDLIMKLLVLNPRDRLSATSALQHYWFWTGEPTLLPRAHPGVSSVVDESGSVRQIAREWKDMDLGDILRPGVDKAVMAWHATQRG